MPRCCKYCTFCKSMNKDFKCYLNRLLPANVHANQRLMHPGYVQCTGLSTTGNFPPKAPFPVLQTRHTCMKRYKAIHPCQMIHTDL